MRPFPCIVLLCLMLATGPARADVVAATAAATDSATVIAAAARTTTPAATPGASRDEDLGPSTAPPWNPPHALPRRELWERVILFPQRVATLPLSGLGWLAERGMYAAEQTAIVKSIVVPSGPKTPNRFGIRFGPPGIGDRTGVGARVEARAPLLNGQMRSDLKVSHAATVRHYHDTKVGAYGRSGSVEYAYVWRPEDRFYGFGMSAPERLQTSYSTRVEQVRGTLSTAWNEREHHGAPRTWMGVWVGPRWMTEGRGRDVDYPSIEQTFPGVAGPEFGRRLAHLVYGGRFSSDWRMGGPHWSNGWRVLVESQRFDAARGPLALGIGGDPVATFTRTTIEMETGVSFMRDPRTIRLLGRVVEQGISSGSDRMAIIDVPSLGGRAGLSGFDPGRFHANDLILGRLSYLFPLVRRLEIETHVETGAVFDDLWQDARIASFHQSFGFSLRGRMDDKPFGAIGLDVSNEGFRLRYAIGNPE